MSPVIFFLIWTTLSGAIYLYVKGAADEAGSIGTLTVAAKGRDNDADTLAISRMQAGGLAGNRFINVQSIQIYKMNEASDGTLSEATGCTGSGAGSCRNIYALNGTSTQVNWPPSQRVVSQGNSDFVGMTVTYKYISFYSLFPSFTQSSTVYFRLEAQS